MVERAVTKHLEILRLVQRGRLWIIERRLQAKALDRRLRDATYLRRRLDAERVQHGRNHVDGVAVLRADFASRPDALGPAHDKRIRGTAPVCLPLPAAERRVARVGPAPRIVVEIFWPAEVV